MLIQHPIMYVFTLRHTCIAGMTCNASLVIVLVLWKVQVAQYALVHGIPYKSNMCIVEPPLMDKYLITYLILNSMLWSFLMSVSR